MQIPECSDVYYVKHITTYKELIESLSLYSGDIAFKSRDESFTYGNLIDGVYRAAFSFSNYKGKYFFIDINEPFYFSVAYFSVVITGNVAVLADKDELEAIGVYDYTILDKEFLLTHMTEKRVDCLPDASEDAFCTLVCSSGTTSKKKGVMLSQKNLLSDTIGGMELYEYRRGAVYVNILPYTHLFGIVADLLGPLYSGGTICYCKNKYQFIDDLRYFQPTVLNLPPSMVYVIHSVLGKTGDFANATGGKLEKVMCAGAKLDESVNNLFSKYGMTVYAAYGLTECSPCVSMSSERFYKPDSVGKILPCCRVKISDDEVYVNGPTVMLGYYGEDYKNQNVINDGWLATGDIGYVDEDNFLFLTGRKTNLIVFDSGLKMQPEIYESELLRISGIKEVLISQRESNTSKFIVQVLIDDVTDQENVKSSINDVFRGTKYWSYLGGIEFRETEFAKNRLGKIIRGQG